MREFFLSADEWFGTVIPDDKWLDFTQEYVKPNFALSFRGRPFARLGDVQIVSGQAGHGKSMLFSQIITAILKGEFGELRYELSDLIPRPVVLLIDTEQSKDDVIAGKKFCYTNAEMRKYVYGPNCKNGWGFSQESLIELFDKWKRATPRIKNLYEERLTDANFHTECDILSTQGYDAAVEYVKKTF